MVAVFALGDDVSAVIERNSAMPRRRAKPRTPRHRSYIQSLM